MTRLAITKGQKNDELRRLKEKSRKTQAFLSETKKVKDKTKDGGDTMSPERSLKNNTLMSGGGGSSGGNSALGSLIVDLILYGQSSLAKRGGINMTQSSF